MKIAIDARPAEKSGFGIARYTCGLVGALSRLDDENEYILLVNYDKLAPLVQRKKNLSLYKIGSKWMGLGEQLELPAVLNKLKPDLFHATSFVAPLFYADKQVITIHDMIHLLFPEHYGIKQRFYYNFVMKKLMHAAAQVIAVSESTRKDILSYYKVGPEKVHVIYNGLDDNFKRIDDVDQITKFKKSRLLPERFVLYVGNRKKHKNLNGIFKAFAQFKKEASNDFHLVISGNRDDRILSLAAELGISKWLVFAGQIGDEAMPLLYNSAALLLCLSFHEGFGYPPLEAMACGVPVIVSAVSSLPEVVGSAGILVDPFDDRESARMITKVLTDKTLAAELSKEGITRAKEFSWDKCARETIAVYKKALTKRS